MDSSNEKYQEGLALFRALVDHSPGSIQVLDPDTGKFLDINERGHMELGYCREEFLALDVFDINTKLTSDSFAEIVRELRLSESKMFRSVHRRKDGSEYPTEVHVKLVRLDREYLVAAVLDISNRVASDEALRKSEARYRTLVENLPQSIIVKDRESRYVTVNELHARSMGLAAQAMEGRNDFDFNPPEMAEKYQRDDREVMESGCLSEFDEKYVLDDHVTWIHTLKVPVRDSTGSVIGILATFWDITERKHAEDRLHLLATVLELAANAIVITDRKGDIEWVNPAFTKFTGYQLEEVLGKTPGDIVKSGVHDANFYKTMWDTLLAGESWQGELTNRRKDGSLYQEVQTITPIKNRDGVISRFVGIKVDISDRKKLEREVIEAQKMESVGRLAGGVAHDFNNLITVITGYTEMAMENADKDSHVHRDLVQVLKSAERAASLTRQLLAFSRKQVLKPAILDLNHVVLVCTKMLERLVGEDIAFIVKADEAVWPVLADLGQIDQVLMNLVVNARDAMPQGGSVVVETSNVELDEKIASKHFDIEPGAYVCVAVSDTGCGMDVETQQHIFDPFFTTKELGKGTGLGLATVIGIIKQSGGSIWVYSELAKGTTFKIYLPRVYVEERMAPAACLDSGIARGTETILLVEDEEALLLLTERILLHAGYAVLCAANGLEALKLAEQSDIPVHLLLTDVIMPGISGRELVKLLSAQHPGLKILYMSGYTDTAISAHGVLDVGVHLLGKPFTSAQLTQKVREVLGAEAP